MMMEVQTATAQLFYDFCLDDHVPEDHMLRRIRSQEGAPELKLF
jgi:transposase